MALSSIIAFNGKTGDVLQWSAPSKAYTLSLILGRRYGKGIERETGLRLEAQNFNLVVRALVTSPRAEAWGGSSGWTDTQNLR
jgi:hypothetical protein